MNTCSWDCTICLHHCRCQCYRCAVSNTMQWNPMFMGHFNTTDGVYTGTDTHDTRHHGTVAYCHIAMLLSKYRLTCEKMPPASISIPWIFTMDQAPCGDLGTGRRQDIFYQLFFYSIFTFLFYFFALFFVVWRYLQIFVILDFVNASASQFLSCNYWSRKFDKWIHWRW